MAARNTHPDDSRYVAPKRADFASSKEWLDALLGEAKYSKACDLCSRVIGPYTNPGSLNAAMTQHRAWAHYMGDTMMNERAKGNVDENSNRVRGYKR